MFHSQFRERQIRQQKALTFGQFLNHIKLLLRNMLQIFVNENERALDCVFGGQTFSRTFICLVAVPIPIHLIIRVYLITNRHTHTHTCGCVIG